MKTELLSPAKNKDIAIAAIDCGADAVYIGAHNFGARQNAANSIDDIKAVTEYAHKFWVKVYVTVNTILSDLELDEAYILIQDLSKIGVDGIIVQDMGLIEKLISNPVDIDVHMSTQCDNRDCEKIKFFSKVGASRVVLARETSLDDIKVIHEKNPDIELESFVHGALCVSYSGQCYLSSCIGGRSANRGECAQPCRKKYTLVNEKGQIIKRDIYPLCLKDFNASKYLSEMINSGVYSFKIEGRLKDIGYVKNITAYYRQELDKCSEKSSSGRCLYPFIPNPEKSFNRGFTSYFLKGRERCSNILSPKSRGEYIGKIISTGGSLMRVQTQKEIHLQDGLCYYGNDGLEGFFVNKIKQDLSNNTYEIYANKKLKINADTKLYRNIDIEFEKNLSKPVKRQIAVSVVWNDKHLTITDEDGISVSRMIENEKIPNNSEQMKSNFVKQFSKTGGSDFYIADINLVSDLPFLPISKINEIRRNIFDELMQKRLKTYKRVKSRRLQHVKYYKNEVDFRANIHNSQARLFYETCGCNVREMSYESQHPKRQVELMRTKYCLKYAINACKTPQKLFLKDDKGRIFPLRFDCNKCEMVVLS